MGRGIDSRNRVWNWVAKLHRLAGQYDNPMPTWFLAPIAGLKLPTQSQNLSPGMGRGINSRNRVWNWVAKLHSLAASTTPCAYLVPSPPLRDLSYRLRSPLCLTLSSLWRFRLYVLASGQGRTQIRRQQKRPGILPFYCTMSPFIRGVCVCVHLLNSIYSRDPCPGIAN
jgi:hypothetical protein